MLDRLAAGEWQVVDHSGGVYSVKAGCPTNGGWFSPDHPIAPSNLNPESSSRWMRSSRCRL
jgi:hypothetical protein